MPAVTREWFESLPPPPSWRATPLRALLRLGHAALGALSGLVLLALMATVPGLNVLALGYLIGMMGRVASQGRFGAALHLAPFTARLAGMLLLGAAFAFPLRYLVELARDAALLAPWSYKAWLWSATAAAAFALVCAHLLLAVARGGAWWTFFRPWSNLRWMRQQVGAGGYLSRTDQTLRALFAALEPWRHFRLGLLGFAGVYAWLLLPALVFDRAPDLINRARAATLLLGGGALVLLLSWMPFLLTHVAVEGRWRAWLEIKTVWQRFRRSPLCWALAAILLYAVSIPTLLYEALFKNNLPRHDARWDVMIVFMLTVVPFKVLVARAWHRAGQRREAWRSWQWFNRLLLTAALGGYVYFIHLARTAGQLGQAALWQFHALLLPFS